MPLTAITAHKQSPGIGFPGERVKVTRSDGSTAYEEHTFDWRHPPNSPENTRPISANFEVHDLDNALRANHDFDAHCVSYVLRRDGAPPLHQPRVKHSGVDWLESQGFTVNTEFFMADIDHPDRHRAWRSPAEAKEAAAKVLAANPKTGVYATSRGLRVVQPITRPIDVRDASPAILAWLMQLDPCGLKLDLSAKDWTRLFRLPNVVRNVEVNGRVVPRPFVSPALLLDRMEPISPTIGVRSRGLRRSRSRPLSVEIATDVPAAFAPLVSRVALAIRQAGGYQGERHGLYLALGGALLRRRVPPQFIPTMVTNVAALAGAEDPLHHRDSAIATVARWASGLPIAGVTRLPAEVIDALDDADEVRRCEPTAPTAQEAHESIVHAIRAAPAGLTLVHAQCGIGKTQAAIRVAEERAATQHATPGPHTRAPAQSKTAISVPTTELAEQIATQLRAQGTPTLRLFGPLSLKREDGSPECAYHATAQHLANGRQSIPWELCRGRNKRRCEHYDTCRARDGADGDDRARIAVGPHGLLKRLDGFAGATGLLVIDEPPSFLASSTYTLAEIEAAAGTLDAFEYRYAAAMAPVIDAFATWAKTADLASITAVAVSAVFERGEVDGKLEAEALQATGTTSLIDAVSSAFPTDHRGPTHPPIRFAQLDIARRSEPIARKIGLASKLLASLRRGILSPTQATIRIEERSSSDAPAERVVIITESDADLATAVARPGAAVALDANADLHAPVLARITENPDLPIVRAFAADPVDVTRVHLRGRASRAAWFTLNRIRDASVFRVPLLRAVARLLDYGAKRTAIVTMRVLEIGFRGDEAAWRDAGQSPAVLQELLAITQPLFSRLPQPPEFGHYGALRGLNKWKDFDSLVTFGDPWPNLGDMQHEADFLNLPEDGEERARAFCRAELEQAHGRLRVPHRTTPCIQIHVGLTRPGGWAGEIEVCDLADMGRPAGESAMSAEDFAALVGRLGGQRRAAEALGISARSVKRYLEGESPIPASVAEKIRVFEEKDQ